MPLLSIETNVPADADTRRALLVSASTLTAEELGKSERYVMVRFTHNPNMLFAGDDRPLAYLELKSIGLPEEATPKLSAALCALVEERLGVPGNRIYIEFSDAPRRMWGWDGHTF